MSPCAPRPPRRNDGPRIPYEGNEDAFGLAAPVPSAVRIDDRPDRPERQERPLSAKTIRIVRARLVLPTSRVRNAAPWKLRRSRTCCGTARWSSIGRSLERRLALEAFLRAGSEATAVSQEVAFKIVSSILGETPVEVKIMENRVDIHVDCGDDSGLLIGREGQTLAALQYLTSRIVSRRMEAPVRVQFDVGDYRERQDEPAP